jgi:hypothetical protein
LRTICVVSVSFRLLDGLSDVVIQKLDKLVADISFIVLNSFKNEVFKTTYLVFPWLFRSD